MNREELLTRRPKLKRYLTIVPMGNDLVLQLRSNWSDEIYRLTGNTVRVFSNVLGVMDGKRTIGEILEFMPGNEEEVVLRMIDDLSRNQILELFEESYTEPDGMQPELASFLYHFGGHKQVAEYYGMLKGTCLSVFHLGNTDCRLKELLSQLPLKALNNFVVKTPGDGVGNVESSDRLISPDEVSDVVGQTNLAAVVYESADPALMRKFNLVFNAAKLTWTSCGFVNGYELVIGPTIVPGETGCYECYKLRRDSNEKFYDELLFFENTNTLPGIGFTLDALKGARSYFFFIELLRIITHFIPPVSMSNECVFNFFSLSSVQHPFLRLPRCKICSTVNDKPVARVWE